MMKRMQAITILLCLLTGLAGCGGTQEADPEEIVLLEPVNANVTTEEAAYRNLYDAQVYQTTVMPWAVEYAFEEAAQVTDLRALPGETVQRGQVLVSADTGKLDREIEQLEEKLATLEEEYLRGRKADTKKLTELQAQAEQLSGIIENLEEDEPEEYLVDAAGIRQKNAAYDKWQKEYNDYRWKCQVQLDANRIEETSLRQKQELYELEQAYYQESLEALRAEREESVLRAETEGVVMAVGRTEYGGYRTEAEEPVIAVGDMSRLVLKCEYVNKNVVDRAEEIYAVIGGKRYALEYQPMDSGEYIRRSSSGETVYSSFEIIDDSGEIQAGDGAVIVLLSKRRESVLAVPKSAIALGDGMPYVYVLEAGESVRRNIRTGMTDGVYTEVLSGLEAGELVKVEESLPYSGGETLTEVGDYTKSFVEKGFAYYPSFSEVRNPIEYGSCYYVETKVELFERVEKGDALVTVTVQPDAPAMQEKQLRLQRRKERLQDILNENEPEENADTIAEKQREIADLEAELAGMKQNAQTTVITAPRSGIVVYLEQLTTQKALDGDCLIARIADEEICYVLTPGAELPYGQEVTVTYRDKEKQEYQVGGIVGSMEEPDLPDSLQSGYTYIRLPAGTGSVLTEANQGKGGQWRQSLYEIAAEMVEMPGVLMVPEEAVTEVNGRTYVHEIGADGKVTARGFVAGGHGNGYYWVIEGLTEGMKLCSE